MVNKKIIKRISIMFTLIFSFIISVFPSTQVGASGTIENIQKYVEIQSVNRDGNNIVFTTSEKINIIDITYEICYVNSITGVKEGDLLTTNTFKKINDTSFSFQVDTSVIGVAIHEVRFTDTGDKHTPSKNTTGNYIWGDVSSTRKKNYVEVTTDELEWFTVSESWGFGPVWNEKWQSNTSEMTFYTFYFNLDTEIDEIEKITFEYGITHYQKEWVWSKEKVWTETQPEIEVDLTSWSWNVNLLKDFSEQEWLDKIANPIENMTYQEGVDYLFKNDYATKPFGANKASNGYDWYLSPAVDFTIVSEESWWGGVYHKQFLDEVSLIKMSYYTNGDYFEDVPVLDEDTGWTKYTADPSWFDKLMEFINKAGDVIVNHWWKIILIAIATIILIKSIISIGIEAIGKILWGVIKYTIGLPITLAVNFSKDKKEQKEFNKRAEKWQQDRSVDNSKYS